MDPLACARVWRVDPLGPRVARSPLVSTLLRAPCAPGAPGVTAGARRGCSPAGRQSPRRLRGLAGAVTGRAAPAGAESASAALWGSLRLRLGSAPDGTCTPTQWELCEMALGGSCDGARGRPARVPGRRERSRRGGGVPSSRLSSASAGRGRGAPTLRRRREAVAFRPRLPSRWRV